MKRMLSIAICICLLVALLPTAAFGATAGNISSFKDVSASKWYAPYIEYVTEKGLMVGTSATAFSPEMAVTRAQYVQVLYAMAGKPEASKETKFTDLKKGAFYEKAVSWAAANGVTEGITKTTFGPDRKVTREQAATFFKAYAEKIAKITTTEAASLNVFPDAASASNYAVKSLQWAVGAKLISGVKSGSKVLLSPKGTLTRAQLATMLKAFDNYIHSMSKSGEDGKSKDSDEKADTSDPKDEQPKSDGKKTDDKINNVIDKDEVETTIHGTIEEYETGDSVFIPDEDTIVYDPDENVLYYENIIDVFTVSDLTEAQVKELENIIKGVAVTDISGAINMLQFYVEASTPSELTTLADQLMENQSVLYAAYSVPLEIADDEVNDPWSITPASPADDRGNEQDPAGNDWWAEAINAYSAWNVVDNHIDDLVPVTAGILDCGFDTNHEDLNGKIRFPLLFKKNVLEEGPEKSHGTHIAGIIGATHNGIGIRGVADRAELMCVDATPGGIRNMMRTSGEFVLATSASIESGAVVINNSWGNSFFPEEAHGTNKNSLDLWASGDISSYDVYLYGKRLINSLYARLCTAMIGELILNGYEDFLILQAAGNGDDMNNNPIEASLNGYYSSITNSVFVSLHPNTLVKFTLFGISYEDIIEHTMIVGASSNKVTDGAYQSSRYSNYGEKVDIYAPGDNIYSTTVDNNYELMSGTSMACPIVAGAAALLWSANPNLSAKEVKDTLINTSSKQVKEISTGDLKPMVDVYAALNKVTGYEATPPAAAGDDLDHINPKMVSIKSIPIKDMSSSIQGTYAVVKEDGSLWMWGANDKGFITQDNPILSSAGNIIGYESVKESPIKVMDGVKKVSLSGVTGTTIAVVKTDGSLWMWGYNHLGLVGNGTTENVMKPTKIMDDVIDVFCDGTSTAAIKSDGSLWMWGYNYYRQMGEGTDEEQTRPVCVMSGVKEAQPSESTCYILTNDGTIWVLGEMPEETAKRNWGTVYTKTPKLFMTGVSHLCSSTIGQGVMGAILENGDLMVWGNRPGAMTFGSKRTDLFDVKWKSPIKLLDNVVEAGLNDENGFAIDKDGNLWAWGETFDGNCGDGMSTNNKSYSADTSITDPHIVLHGIKHVDATEGGMAIDNEGSLLVWGHDAFFSLYYNKDALANGEYALPHKLFDAA